MIPLPAGDSVDLAAGTDRRILRWLASIETVSVGIVETFDPQKQEASVRKAIGLLRSDEETTDIQEEEKPIEAVPVGYPGTERGGISFKLERGDVVLLLFSKESLEDWLGNGGSVPGSRRRLFGQSSPIAIPLGRLDFGHPRPAPPEEGIAVWVKDGPSVVVKKGGIEAGGADHKVTSEGPLRTYLGQLHSAIAALVAPPGGGTVTNWVPPTIPSDLGSSKVKVGA